MAPHSCPAAIPEPESQSRSGCLPVPGCGVGARGPNRHLSRAAGTPACNRRPAHPATCLPGSRVRGRGLRRREREEPVAELLQQQQRLHRQQPAVLIRILLRHICEDGKERTAASGCLAQPVRHLLEAAQTRGTPAQEVPQPLCKDGGKPAETRQAGCRGWWPHGGRWAEKGRHQNPPSHKPHRCTWAQCAEGHGSSAHRQRSR